MAIIFQDDWGRQIPMAGDCEETQYDTHSKLLGPDGHPLQYKRNPIGFDLTKKRETQND